MPTSKGGGFQLSEGFGKAGLVCKVSSSLRSGSHFYPEDIIKAGIDLFCACGAFLMGFHPIPLLFCKGFLLCKQKGASLKYCLKPPRELTPNFRLAKLTGFRFASGLAGIWVSYSFSYALRAFSPAAYKKLPDTLVPAKVSLNSIKFSATRGIIFQPSQRIFTEQKKHII